MIVSGCGQRGAYMTFWSDLVTPLRRRRGAAGAPPTDAERAPTSGARVHVEASEHEDVARRAAHEDPGASMPACDARMERDDWQRSLLDLLPDALLIIGPEGEIAYRNAAARVLLDDSGGLLLREARALAAAELQRSAPRTATCGRAAREVMVGTIRYRVDATVAPDLAPHERPSDDASGPAVLVTIVRSSPPLPSVATLHQRFQLTAREAGVALLLAEGSSNASIARRLGISASTVRHYTETVLLKLDVPSRAAVAAMLFGIYERTSEYAQPEGPRAAHARLAD